MKRVFAAAFAALAMGFAPGAPGQKGPALEPHAKEIAYAKLPANREGHLPAQKRGYYREYTVKTPGERTRGARRIIWGKGGEFYYTDDHYNHFLRVRE